MWNNNFLTVEEVSKIIGVSCERVREKAATGDLVGLKPKGARRWRFTRKAVANYMGCTPEEI